MLRGLVEVGGSNKMVIVVGVGDDGCEYSTTDGRPTECRE